MQCKDIPDDMILKFLAARQGRWTSFMDLEAVLPREVPFKLRLAKMRGFIRRGLSGGCDCGCRGDFEITDKGLALIGEPRIFEYTGY